MRMTSLLTFIVPATFKSLNKAFTPEVHLAIFEHIDNGATSACLGLTCMTFYNIRRVQYGTVSLRQSVS
jgi:hypothetical protein